MLGKLVIGVVNGVLQWLLITPKERACRPLLLSRCGQLYIILFG